MERTAKPCSSFKTTDKYPDKHPDKYPDKYPDKLYSYQ